MKLKQLVLLGVTSCLASVFSISGYASVLANPSAHTVSQNTSLTKSHAVVAQNQSPITGTFVAAEKPTSGTARIVTENGQRYLELDGAFKTSDLGPDLHVLLDTSGKPPQTYKNQSSYVNLGKLQKFSGSQRYPIPAAINLSEFKSVVIWCRMANATFGYAPLGGATSASSQ